MVESSDGMWSTGDGNGNPLQDSCLESPVHSLIYKTEPLLLPLQRLSCDTVPEEASEHASRLRCCNESE